MKFFEFLKHNFELYISIAVALLFITIGLLEDQPGSYVLSIVGGVMILVIVISTAVTIRIDNKRKKEQEEEGL